MKRNLILQAVCCLIAILAGCSKDALKKSTTAAGAVSKSHLAVTATGTDNTNPFRGINWADPNGNEGDGRVVLPSGMTASLTTTQAAAVSTRISSAVKVSGGTTIRMPINPWTASSSTYWPVYQAAINAIVSNGCKVILCYWPVGVHHVPDATQWTTMWQTVDNVYKNNTSVLYEPINEPVDYSSTDLNNLYAGFLTTFSPANGKCILDGTGYAADVTTVGADTRLTNQYLGLHCYWWFWGAYDVWSSYYSIMSARTGSYAARTVVTEIGIETFRNMSFWWQWDTGVYVDQAFLTGALSYARDNSMGTIAWSGVNDIDTYRWYKANDTLVEVSPGTANMYRWSWKLTASPVWLGSIADGRYKLQNRASGLNLDNLGSTTDGATIAQWADGTSPNQKWNVSYTNGYYTLSCVTGKECVDTGGNTADGSSVKQNTVNTNSTQRWSIVSTGSGYYKIINLSTGKCIDTGGLTANGSVMQQWTSGSSYNQQWKLIAQ